MNQIGAGIVGLGSRGQHHAEQLLLRDDCKLAAVYDSDPAASARTPGSASVAGSLVELLANRSIELLFIAVPFAERAQLTATALQAGKHVAAELPLCGDAHEARRLLALARSSGKLLVPVRNRDDDQFLTAREAVRSGAIGPVNAARLAVWTRGLNARSGEALLVERGGELLHELTELVPQRPISVFARPRVEQGDPRGFLLHVEFDGGATATIDVHLGSPVASQKGWILAGPQGGYRNMRRYHVANDGEVFDTPAQPVPPDPRAFYDRLMSAVRDGAQPGDALEQIETVAAVLQAGLKSTRSGRVEPVG